MMRLSKYARRRDGVLAVVVCLAIGCGTTAGPRHRDAMIAPLPEAPIELAPAAERKSEAIAYFATGFSKQLTQGLDAALEFYRKAQELDPHNVAQGVDLARVYLNRREPDKAVALLQQVIESNPKPEATPYFWLGMALKAQNKTDESVAAFQRAHRIDPADLNAIQALLDIAVQTDDLTQASRLLDQAYNSRSDDAEYWMRLGDLTVAAMKQKTELAADSDPKRPQTAYLKALELDPDNADIIARLATVYESDPADEAKAIELYDRLSRLRPDDVGIHLTLAQNYLKADEKQKAVTELEHVLRLEPLKFVNIYNELAGLYEDLDQDERAVTTYQQSLAVKPNQLHPYLQIALIHLRHKRFELADGALDIAREKFPTNYEVSYFRGLLLNEKKEHSKALAAFADAETLAAEAPEPVKLEHTFYFYYGSAYERAGNIDKAAELFKKSIELEPSQHAAYNYLGYMWADKGIHLKEAHEFILKALERSPDNPAYLDSLGWVLHKLGKNKEALPHLQRAAELIKEDALILEHLADILIALGRPQDALPHLQHAQQLEPDNKGIGKKIEKLKSNSTSNSFAKP